MDERNIKISIKNMNVWLDECHNDSDTVVMTANVLRSIRDNYCELLRCRDEIESLKADKIIAERHEKDARELYKDVVIQLKTAKSEAIKEFAEKLKNEIISDTAYGCDITQHSGYYDHTIKIGDIPEYIDNLLKEMEQKNKHKIVNHVMKSMLKW